MRPRSGECAGRGTESGLRDSYADPFAARPLSEFEATLLTGDPAITPLVGEQNLAGALAAAGSLAALRLVRPIDGRAGETGREQLHGSAPKRIDTHRRSNRKPGTNQSARDRTFAAFETALQSGGL